MHALRRVSRWPPISFLVNHPTAVRGLLRELLLVAVFLSMALWVTWPLAKHFRWAVPTSPNHAGTVPLLNVWTIWWNAESLGHGLRDYWDAPIFAPVPGTFAFSEPQPITLGLAPLVWLSNSPTLAYNVYLIASLALNGWFAARLLRLLGCRSLTQVCGGVAMILHPLALRHVEAIQLLSLWASLWTITALIKVHRQPSWRSGAKLGLAFATTGAACLHHALFLGLLLLATAWLIIPRRQPLPTLQGLLISGLVAASLLGPLVWPMHVIHGQHALVRDPEVVASLSASLASWLTLPDTWLLSLGLQPDGIDSQKIFPGPLLPGIASTLLAVGGVAYWLVAKLRTVLTAHRRSDSGQVGLGASHETPSRASTCHAATRSSSSIAMQLLIALGLVSCVLSLGPNLAWGAFRPWEVLSDWFAPLARVRSPYRFAYFTQMVLLLLAVWTADGLLRWGQRSQPSPRGGWWRRAVAGLGGVCLLVIALEHRPPQYRLAYPPRDAPTKTNWVSVVANQPTSGAVLCLPTSAGISEAAQEQETRWMVYASLHRRSILNGYSGFIPERWQNLSYQLHRNGLTQSVMAEIQALGCEIIVIRHEATVHGARLREQMAEQARRESPRESPYLELVFDDERYQVWRFSNVPR